MNEYFIDLQDKNGTSYGCTDKWGNEMYFDDLEEAKMTAKTMLRDHIVLVRVFDSNTHELMYFTQSGSR